MMPRMSEGRGRLYLVPFFEGDWVNHIPSPRRASAPTPRECAAFARRCHDAFRRMAALIGGRFVVGVHTSPAFRDTAWTSPLREAWLMAHEAGATIALHPHEEYLWLHHRGRIAAHWRTVIAEGIGRLRALGLCPQAFRSGYGLLSRSMLPILEGAGLLLDFSPAPGWRRLRGAPGWPAGWTSARRFCPRNPAHCRCGHRPSRILGIPIGAAREDPGEGWRYLVNEHCDLPTLQGIWDRLCRAANGLRGPRCVSFIWCGYGLDRPALTHQALAFLEYVLKTGGIIPEPTEVPRLLGGLEDPEERMDLG